MNLSEKFNHKEFSDWIEEFIPDFSSNPRKVDVPHGLSGVKSINTLGEAPLGIRIFVIETEKDPSGKKIGLAKESFNLIKNYGTPNALIAYYSEDSSKWRLSLLTSTAEWSQGKIITKLSNPKRQSYVLGPQSKVNTPTRFLIKRDSVTDLNDLKSRFSLEVVNKEFYKEISESFIKLVGGTLGNGRGQKKFESILKLPFVADHSQTSIEFSVRLIGRIIFCWFLREKKSADGISLMPKELLSLSAIEKYPDYYHQILEPIFFEVLNQQGKARKDPFYDKPYSSIPYLNGGLFSAHDDDFYKRNNGDFQSQFHNTLLIPDQWFIDLFNTLETYNFTIDENTSFDEELSIDPEMLGRIFENLLAEINPETGESARKSTGSYYTPRVIVDYMVDESLLLYLKQQTDIEEGKLRAIISYDLSDDSEYPLNELEKQTAIDALEKIKILDPACGSGAFPIGALQKMVFILQQVDPDGQLWFKKQIQHTSPEIRRVLEREFIHKNFDYIRKLGVIRENIYGIDIQPIATEISRLRCFLTLVVDERIDDSLENRGIEPLPNLDFKFVTANSLIGLPSTGKQVQFGLFEDSQGISELKEIRDLFFNSSGSEREMLKLKFVQSQNMMFQRLISEGRRGHADLTTMLTSWDPFNHKASTWFDPEWMFGIKEGFDVVIANPPYISHVNYKYDDKATLRLLYSSYSGRADVYVVFYERGIKLLRDTGILTYITPNKFFRAGYGLKIRSFIYENTKITSILDFGDTPIFEATTYPAVLVIENSKSQKYDFVYTKAHSIEDVNQSIKGQIFSSDYLKNQLWSFEKDELGKIWEKLKIGTVTLKKYINNEFYRGIVTGLNEAFIINSDQRDKLISLNPNVSKIIKPYLRGREVKRWRVESSSYIIFTYHGINISEYPEIEDYLLEFKPKLEKRATSNNHKWYELQQPQTGIYKRYEDVKIISTDIAKRCEFTIDKSGSYIDATIFCIPKNDFYLLALLNSNLMETYYKSISSTIRGDFLRFKKIYLDLLPVKLATQEQKKAMSSKVDEILSITSSSTYSTDSSFSTKIANIENEINQLVYELYGLTEQEISVIEK